MVGWVSRSASLGPGDGFTAGTGPVDKLTYTNAKCVGFSQLVKTFCCVDTHLSSGRKDMYLLIGSFQNMVKLDLLSKEYSTGSVEKESKKVT